MQLILSYIVLSWPHCLGRLSWPHCLGLLSCPSVLTPLLFLCPDPVTLLALLSWPHCPAILSCLSVLTPSPCPSVLTPLLFPSVLTPLSWASVLLFCSDPFVLPLCPDPMTLLALLSWPHCPALLFWSHHPALVLTLLPCPSLLPHHLALQSHPRCFALLFWSHCIALLSQPHFIALLCNLTILPFCMTPPPCSSATSVWFFNYFLQCPASTCCIQLDSIDFPFLLSDQSLSLSHSHSVCFSLSHSRSHSLCLSVSLCLTLSLLCYVHLDFDFTPLLWTLFETIKVCVCLSLVLRAFGLWFHPTVMDFVWNNKSVCVSLQFLAAGADCGWTDSTAASHWGRPRHQYAGCKVLQFPRVQRRGENWPHTVSAVSGLVCASVKSWSAMSP